MLLSDDMSSGDIVSMLSLSVQRDVSVARKSMTLYSNSVPSVEESQTKIEFRFSYPTRWERGLPLN
jgi:hypothetical protein